MSFKMNLTKREWLKNVIHSAFTNKLLLSATALSLIFSLTIPMATQAIVDRVIVYHGYSTLYLITFAIVILGILDAGVTAIRSVIASFLSNMYGSRIAEDLIKNLANTSSSSLLCNEGLLRAHVVDEINTFRQDYLDIIVYFHQSIVPTAFYIVMMFLISSSMSLVVLVTIPIYFIVYFFIKSPAKKQLLKAIQLRSEGSAAVHMMVSAIETVKAYGLSKSIAGNIVDLINRASYAEYLTSKQTSLWQGACRICNAMAQATLLFIGARSVMDGAITLGQLMAFQIFAGRLMEPITRAGIMMERWERIRLHLEKWEHEIQAAPTAEMHNEGIRDDESPVLLLNDVSFQYPNSSARQVKNIELTIRAGEFVFLLGPSGSGKSTIVRLASGLIKPDAGSVLISGNEISAVDENTRRFLIAAAFQEPVLLPGSVLENITNFEEHPTLDLSEVLNTSGVDQIIKKLPGGLKANLGESSIPLSGGERQRICIARLLACFPALIVLDEGTSGLQRDLEIDILTKIRARMKPYQAALVITHREDLASIGTRVIRIDDGIVQSDVSIKNSDVITAA